MAIIFACWSFRLISRDSRDTQKRKIRMDSESKLKVCPIKGPLFLLSNACGASYKQFYIFFVVPLWGHFSIGILIKTKKWKVNSLYFCELQQELHVHLINFWHFPFFSPHMQCRIYLYSSCGILFPVWTPDNISDLTSFVVWLSRWVVFKKSGNVVIREEGGGIVVGWGTTF